MIKNSLANTNPELLSEWDFAKNGLFKPSDVTAGSHKKAWWICNKGVDHKWEADIHNRSKGIGCPICRGLKVVSSNCLATTHPEIARQWHIEKNELLTPYNITAGSHKKVWWQCEVHSEHFWQTSISHRVNGTGCPYCTNQKVSITNSIATVRPDLVKEWHPTKNKLSPSQVNAYSSKKAWWKCLKVSHEWQASIKNRAIRKLNCPQCSNQRVSPTNNLEAMRPTMAKEWHPTKNGKILPKDVIYGSNKRFWWQCLTDKDHVWEARVSERKIGYKCPYCTNRKRSNTNNLFKLYPNLANEWHPSKNGSTKPSDVLAGTAKSYWWKCPKGSDHEWKAPINARVKGTGCPICQGLKVVSSNSLSTTNPKLAEQWHPTRNLNLTPNNVVATSMKKVWWQCPVNADHVWEAIIDNRTRKGYGCPFCSGRHADSQRNLTITNPELVMEWHPTKNEGLKPEDFLAKSSIKIWWVCKKDNTHIWKSVIASRTSGVGCPYCNSGWTIENIRHFVKSIRENLDALTPTELYVIFQQNGLLSLYGNTKPFIDALKTGKFPKEEIDKFIEGKSSLVDDLINNHSLKLEDNLNQQVVSDMGQKVSLDETIESFPVIETKDILTALDNKIISSADEEAVEFLLTSGCAKIWTHAFTNEKEALSQAENFNGGKYSQLVKARFLEEYRGAKELQIPDGYNFRKNGTIQPPNLMQRLSAYLVKTKQKVGNWSGTGAGKTLSAILASRTIESKVTVICCPNSVVAGWKENILNIYPDSIVFTKNLNPKINYEDDKHSYLVLNYEVFQQENSEANIKNLVDKNKIDFIVIDEIHYSKQRVVEDISKRRHVITGMISEANNKNSNLHILGMSATPVINNLYEGRALLEMISGLQYDDLKTVPSVSNCIALYQKLTTTGIRWKPIYEQTINVQIIDVNCSSYLDEIKALGFKSNYVDLESILTKAKLPEIRKNINKKTIVYTHYVKNILDLLKQEIQKDGWKVAFFTGEDKSGLESFIDGDTDVLIASSAISTGVDGLQDVCNRLIVNILPWTNAEFEQLKGRIYRQGQKQNQVDIIVPLTFAVINGQEWSWCKSKWNRIQYKKSIADAAVDGIIPEGHLRSSAQAYEDVMNWLNRLENGDVRDIERQVIHIPLSDTVIQSRLNRFGDFSEMNRRINTSYSKTTFERFGKNPEEWEQYHALYRDARKDWLVIPYEEIINWCKKRPDLVIGDFGCGEAKIAEAIGTNVYSFDFVAINDNVIPCDISHVPLEDESLDVAVFSLSLMGINFTDYIKEAYRCLKLDGILLIVEPTSRFSNIDEFIKGIEKLGFDIFKPEEQYKFTFLRAVKSDRNPQDIQLRF